MSYLQSSLFLLYLLCVCTYHGVCWGVVVRKQPGGVSSSPPQDNGSYSAFSMFSVKNRNQTLTPGMVAHRYHPSTPVAEAGESHVQNPLRLSGVSRRLGVEVDRCYQARKHGRGKRGSSSLSLRREPGYGWGVGKQNSRGEVEFSQARGSASPPPGVLWKPRETNQIQSFCLPHKGLKITSIFF